MRMRTMIERKKANAHVMMGQYDEAMPLFGQVVDFQRKMAAIDPQDLRALADLEVILDDQAVGLETAADPALAAPGSDSKNERGRILAQACDTLREVIAIMDRMLRLDATNENWKFVRASAEVRLATDESVLKQGQDAEPLARAGLASFREMAANSQACLLYTSHRSGQSPTTLSTISGTTPRRSTSETKSSMTSRASARELLASTRSIWSALTSGPAPLSLSAPN